MTAEEAIEVIEATPIMRMERTSDTPLSELGEALIMAIEALRRIEQLSKLFDDAK